MYQTSGLVHGFAKSHRRILLYGYFSLGFLLFHLLLLLLIRSTLRTRCFSRIIPLFCINFSFPVLREVTTKPLNIRDLPVPSSTVSLVCDGAAQGMKVAVGTQGTVPLGDDTGCLEFTNPKHNGLFRERTESGNFLSLQDSLQARKDVTDIPLPSSQCSLEFDKRGNKPSPSPF